MKSYTNNIIEELWYGNIDPLNGGIFKSPEKKELIQYIARHREDLEKTLTDEQKKYLKNLMTAILNLTDSLKPQYLSAVSSSVQDWCFRY